MAQAEMIELDFQAAADAAEAGEALIVDVDGFEGPLHALLALARTQKVDLLKLSITRLADQYLAFVQEARKRRFRLAADYLVMAAWLAYLKSRLLLPKPAKLDPEAPAAEELAAMLAFRLAKLDAMREAVEGLKASPQTGRDVFTRGDPEAVTVVGEPRHEADLYGLISAYVGGRRREAGRRYAPRPVKAYPLEAARVRLRGLMQGVEAWTPLAGLAPTPRDEDGPSRASYLASTLSAGLEMVKEGRLEARQLQHFAEVYLRTRSGAEVAPRQAAE